MCNKCEQNNYECGDSCINTCAPKCDPCRKQDKLYYCGKDQECLNILSGDDLMKALEVYGEVVCQMRDEIATSNGTHVDIITVEAGATCANGGTTINIIDNTTGNILKTSTICNGGTGNVESVTGNIVDNSDPLNPVINLNFEDCCFEEVTVEEVNLLITNNDLAEGTTYKITGVHPTLYDDGTTSGTTIFLKALSKNKLTTNGHGIFYNPRYDQSVQGFGIYSNFMRGDLTSIVGNFDISGREPVTTDNGATGIIYTKGLIKYVSGDWNTSTSITGDNSGATASIANFTKPLYIDNSTVIWGGYVWRNLKGNLGKDLDILNLDYEWEKIVYNDVDYDKVLDIIEYDIENDYITRRYDSVNVIDVRFNKFTSDFFADNYNISFNAIAVMQWGNGLTFSGSGVFGVANINVIDAYFENVNFRGSYQANLTFDNDSSQRNLTFDNNSYQDNLTFDNISGQRNLTFDNGSYQSSLTFDNGSSQQNLTFDNRSSQSSLTFDNGSSQQNLTFDNRSGQSSLTFDSNSTQLNLTFYNSSSQSSLTFDNGSFQQNLTLDNGSSQENLIFDNLQIDYNSILYTSKTIENLRGVGRNLMITVPDLTSATNIFDNTLIKEIVVTPSGTVKMKYLDDLLAYQFVDLDS